MAVLCPKLDYDNHAWVRNHRSLGHSGIPIRIVIMGSLLLCTVVTNQRVIGFRMDAVSHGVAGADDAVGSIRPRVYVHRAPDGQLTQDSQDSILGQTKSKVTEESGGANAEGKRKPQSRSTLWSILGGVRA